MDGLFQEIDMRLTYLGRPGALLLRVLAGLLVTASIASAQVLYGSIVGAVSDSTGAAMPGASVTIEQAETKLTREVITDAAGGYQFTAVPSGTYTISVKMNGF